MARTGRAILTAIAIGALPVACATPPSPTAAPAGAPAPVAAPAPAPGERLPAPAGPTAGPVVRRGMDAGAVRRALGEPSGIERIPSGAAPGTTYERWTYPDREVVLIDGRVIDVLP